MIRAAITVMVRVLEGRLKKNSSERMRELTVDEDFVVVCVDATKIQS